MGVFTERKAIQQRMAEIREERRELADEYHKLMDRLREIDHHEIEAIDAEALVGSMADALRTLKEFMPEITADQMLEKLHHMAAEQQKDITYEEEPPKVEVAPAHVISHQQHLDATKGFTKQRMSAKDVEDLKRYMADTLEEAGVPVKLADLQEQVENHFGVEFKKGTFHRHIRELAESNPKVQKAHRGFYQFKF